MKKSHEFIFTVRVTPKGTAVGVQIFRAGKLCQRQAKAFIDPLDAFDNLIDLATGERDGFAAFLRDKNARN